MLPVKLPSIQSTGNNQKYCVFFSTIIVLFFASCSRNIDTKNQQELVSISTGPVELTPAEMISISNDMPRVLTDVEVKNAINKFKSNLDLKTKSVAGDKPFNISKIDRQSQISTNSNNIPLLQVDVNEGEKQSTILMSADSRAPVVLAYYTTPDSNSTEPVNLPLIELAKNSLKNQIEVVEFLKDSLRSITIDKISEKLKIDKRNWNFEKYRNQISVENKIKSKSVMQPTLDMYNDGQVIAFVGPLTNVAWSNGVSYNRVMPQTCPKNWLWDQRIPISSAAIAIAHILSFFQPSITVHDYANGGTNNLPINWPYLTENSEILEEAEYFGTNPRPQDPIQRRNMVASLMKFIGEKCGITYTCTTSSVSDANLTSFLFTYGIKTSPSQVFDIQKIKTSLQNVNPVLMYGQTVAGAGSWWVIDGVAITSFLNV